jgi:hypothetical protein
VRRHLAATLVLTAAASALACHASDTCNASAPCPTVDQDPSSGELRFAVQKGVLDITVGDASAVTEFDLTGGEIDLDLDACTDGGANADCTATLTRLRIELAGADIEVIANVGTLHVVAPVLSLAAPVAAVRHGTVYVVDAGTMLHTCATIDGQAWHGAMPLSAPLILDVSGGPAPSVSFDATVPLALRADDAQCSTFSLPATVNALAVALGP